MPFEIVAIVVVAALAHASWNALVKSDDDRLVTLGAVNAVRFLLCIPIVLVLPLPASASWPFLAASAILHVGYYTFLISAYRYGDLSKVYPLARGLSPLIVAAGAFAFAGGAAGSDRAGGGRGRLRRYCEPVVRRRRCGSRWREPRANAVGGQRRRRCGASAS